MNAFHSTNLCCCFSRYQARRGDEEKDQTMLSGDSANDRKDKVIKNSGCELKEGKNMSFLTFRRDKILLLTAYKPTSAAIF